MQRITFPALMGKLVRMPAEVETELHLGLVKSAVQVHKTAVEKFGHYQPGIGPYPAWALLAIRTITEKQNRGMDEPNPLIGAYGPHRYNDAALPTKRTIYPTSLRQSLAIQVNTLDAQVGTNDPVGEWQEYGTSRGIPPRPFLRPALYQNQDWIRETIKASIAMGLVKWL